MPNAGVLEQIDVSGLVQSGGEPRDPTHPFKLTAAMRALVHTRLADLKAKDATTIRAFRQPAGGTAELAGTSTTTTVVAAGPLTPGVTDGFWIVGHNSQGDGPERNHVTHAVPVGP